jgi:hypothetical protein
MIPNIMQVKSRSRGKIKKNEENFEKKGPKIMFTIPWDFLAEGPGFEPGLTGPEPVVLPLDDPSENKDSEYKKA